MTKIKIITDSISDLTKEEIAKYDVDVMPLTVTIDGVEYEDIDNVEYIERMKEAGQFSTSQPAAGKFLDAYKKWTDLGYKIISIHVADKLSGTYSTAVSIASEFKDVAVINTKTASKSMEYFIRDAFEAIKEGKAFEEIIQHLNEKVEKIFTYVTVDDLTNLVKGGRLKKSAGLIGGLLNIKVLTTIDKEEGLIAVDKVRGKKKVVQSLVNRIAKDTEGLKINQIFLAHVLSNDYVSLIIEEIKNKLGYQIKEQDILIPTPAISTHAGPGACGILVETK